MPTPTAGISPTGSDDSSVVSIGTGAGIGVVDAGVDAGPDVSSASGSSSEVDSSAGESTAGSASSSPSSLPNPVSWTGTSFFTELDRVMRRLAGGAIVAFSEVLFSRRCNLSCP